MKLRACHIHYRDGMLTSALVEGTPESPYPTYGRTTHVELITPREAVGMGATLKQDHEGLLVLGYEMGAALWRLVHPITATGPPSEWEKDPERKLRRDIAALKRYGY